MPNRVRSTNGCRDHKVVDLTPTSSKSGILLSNEPQLRGRRYVHLASTARSIERGQKVPRKISQLMPQCILPWTWLISSLSVDSIHQASSSQEVKRTPKIVVRSCQRTNFAHTGGAFLFTRRRCLRARFPPTGPLYRR